MWTLETLECLHAVRQPPGAEVLKPVLPLIAAGRELEPSSGGTGWATWQSPPLLRRGVVLLRRRLLHVLVQYRHGHGKRAYFKGGCNRRQSPRRLVVIGGDRRRSAETDRDPYFKGGMQTEMGGDGRRLTEIRGLA